MSRGFEYARDRQFQIVRPIPAWKRCWLKPTAILTQMDAWRMGLRRDGRGGVTVMRIR